MELSPSLGFDIAMSLGDNTGHSDWHVSSSGMALKHQKAQVMAQTLSILMAFCANIGHRCQHSTWLQKDHKDLIFIEMLCEVIVNLHEFGYNTVS